jgi:thioredoxin-related protein
MKKLYVLVIVCIVAFVSNFNTKAQEPDSTDIYGNIWYLDKQVAIDAAILQNKQILICYGSTTCTYTNDTRRLLGTGQFKKLIDENYILWYADKAKVGKLSDQDLNEYFYTAMHTAMMDFFNATGETRLTFNNPALCITNKWSGFHKSYGVCFRPENEQVLKILAEFFDPVANDKVIPITSDAKVYFSGKGLVVNSKNANETISIYSMVGSLVDKFQKTEQSVIRDASSYPSGIFIVTSSSGWTKKIINRK